MANWHVLEKTGNGYRMAYHIAIPAANNAAGFSYRTALINSGIGGTTILKDGDGTLGTIDATEKSNIASGSLLEQVVTVTPPGGLTGPQTITYINQDYTANSAVILADLQNRLSQYGRSG